MGYQVDHLGAFEVTPPLSTELRTWIDGPLQEDPWEAAAERGLELELDTHCTWWTDGDPTRLQWTGAEKSYDGTAWLQWLMDHALGPDGHAVTGTVHRFAEPEPGFVEASSIHANGVMVTEVYYDTDGELPWQEDGPDGPFLGDAFFHLSEGEPDEAQQTLLAWLGVTPLRDHGGVVTFLRDVAEHWPDPDAVRTAVDAAAARSPSGSSAEAGARPRSLWDRLLGR